MFYDRPLIEYIQSVLGYAVDASKPINGPLWYIRELIVFVLLSPLIWKIMKATRYYAMALFIVLYLISARFIQLIVNPLKDKSLGQQLR